MAAIGTITRAEQLGYCEGFSGSAPVTADPFGPNGTPDWTRSNEWRRGFELGRADQESRREARQEYWPMA